LLFFIGVPRLYPSSPAQLPNNQLEEIPKAFHIFQKVLKVLLMATFTQESINASPRKRSCALPFSDLASPLSFAASISETQKDRHNANQFKSLEGDKGATTKTGPDL